MTASRKKSAQGLQLDQIFLEGAQSRAGFWSDEVPGARPIATRRDIAEFAAISTAPANDHGWDEALPPNAGSAAFTGSRRFWLALAISLGAAALFLLVMAGGRPAQLAAILASPWQHREVWGGLVVLAAAPWLVAHGLHRQAVQSDILQRVLLASGRLQHPSEAADAAAARLEANFDDVFTAIDQRMALLDEKATLLASRIAATATQSAEQAEMNIANMRSMLETGETQREALERTGMMISTEMIPVISKLEATVASLAAISQDAGGILGEVGGQLQQSTQQLKSCLDGFNAANLNVLPDVEKRMLKFEATVARLPEQLDATIGRLSPLSETIADAAMLSTANIEVIDQLAKNVTATLEKSRKELADVASSGADMLQQAVEAQAGRFRGMLESVLVEEASRVSALSRELNQLADTAGAVVGRLQQPVGNVTEAADRALANVNAAIDALDLRIDSSFGNCVTQLNEASGRLASTIGREIEASAMGLQTRLAASSTELMQRMAADTARFEALISEVAERSSNRMAGVVRELPATLSQRIDSEIVKIDSALRGSVFGLMDQMRQSLDAVPARLSGMTHDMLLVLEQHLARAFEDVAQRADGLNADFHRSATEASETMLQGYVDFIYLAVDRFRTELEAVNANFTTGLESRLRLQPQGEGTDGQPGPGGAA